MGGAIVSAFLVDRACISAIVMVAQRHVRDGASSFNVSPDDLGRMLWRENMLSLGARYGDAVDEEALASYHFGLTSALLSASPAALIKNLHCYAYQACEHDGWETSDAKKLCDRLESWLVHRLPGYDKAPWGFSDAASEASGKVTQL